MSEENLVDRLRNAYIWATAENDHFNPELGLEAADAIDRITAERDELQQTFDLMWEADQRAIKRWQEVNPGNDLVWPDQAKLSVWLMEQYARITAERDGLLQERKRLTANPVDHRYWEGRYRDEAAENERLRKTLEKIALLDEADGHELTVKHAHEVIAIATNALGKHPSEILRESLSVSDAHSKGDA